MKKDLEATLDGGNQFYQSFIDKGKIAMLNLLKFKEIANDRSLEHLKPKKEISGEEAYQLYLQNLKPLGHRTATLEDTRLLPTVEMKDPL